MRAMMNIAANGDLFDMRFSSSRGGLVLRVSSIASSIANFSLSEGRVVMGKDSTV